MSERLLLLWGSVHPQQATADLQEMTGRYAVFSFSFLFYFLRSQKVSRSPKRIFSSPWAAVSEKSVYKSSPSADLPSKIPWFSYSRAPCSTVDQGLQTQMPSGTKQWKEWSRLGEGCTELAHLKFQLIIAIGECNGNASIFANSLKETGNQVGDIY